MASNAEILAQLEKLAKQMPVINVLKEPLPVVPRQHGAQFPRSHELEDVDVPAILANESIEKSLHEYGRGVAGGAEIYTNVDAWLHEQRGGRIAARLAAAWSVRMHLEAAAQVSSDPTFIAWAQEQARCLRESSELEKPNAQKS